MPPDWLHILDQCPSTNSWAIAHAAQLHHGDVVLTRQQTAGRGQHGRIWHAPTGVLTASFILDDLPLAGGLSLAIGLAAIAAVEDLAPDLAGELRLKWANDLYLRGRKLAGILCEGTIRGTAQRMVVGIGLNRSATFEAEWQRRAISLHEVTIAPDELPLLEGLRYHLLQTAKLWRSQGLEVFLPGFRQRDFLWNQPITVERPGGFMTGTAMGITAAGELRLRLADGTIQHLRSGHIPQG
jgi:BirA family transcriptional regulator, biotin operon repressor / biotin---[acetyl-CoA-carboxylase] ligase